AFLFAALEILQPLYLACLERMRVLLADWASTGESHPNWEKEIRKILDHAGDHTNEVYYIHKTIIVHNLYGVDIMEEAVEICKLRLFLKLAAQLEPGQKVEPLPDIDFNVRSGNTLVGYASKEEIRRAFTEHQGGGGASQGLLQGIEHSLDDYRRILEQAEDADRAFQRFHALQEDTGVRPEDFRSAKQQLNRILDGLREQLDRFLAGDYDLKNLESDKKFEAWRSSHEPFHWFIEFYGIMNAGGFDVIIGNPPYLAISVKEKSKYLNYYTAKCKNLYPLVMERALGLAAASTFSAYIVPLSSLSTEGYLSLQEILSDQWLCFSSFDDRPAHLFDDLDKNTLSIILYTKSKSHDVFSSKMNRWAASERSNLFELLDYSVSRVGIVPGCWLREGNKLTVQILDKVTEKKSLIHAMEDRHGKFSFYYSRKINAFLQCLDFIPEVRDANAQLRPPSEFKEIRFKEAALRDLVFTTLNSSIFWLFTQATTDGSHLNKREVYGFPIVEESDLFAPLARKLSKTLKHNSTSKTMRYKHDTLTVQCIIPKHSKPIIDEIDTVLAAHYGFTEEELDFIINYDIKYRMGLGG
ncbi:MAG TPA: Eco57I restriction-modification methylase domain-containing protein, partial [Opitutales bacterium]|nr:Eco57I restriction-modification methylase domain-containing protein [Opitutales bacterium]